MWPGEHQRGSEEEPQTRAGPGGKFTHSMLGCMPEASRLNSRLYVHYCFFHLHPLHLITGRRQRFSGDSGKGRSPLRLWVLPGQAWWLSPFCTLQHLPCGRPLMSAELRQGSCPRDPPMFHKKPDSLLLYIAKVPVPSKKLIFSTMRQGYFKRSPSGGALQ